MDKNCKICYYKDICKKSNTIIIHFEGKTDCENFKDKRNIIELPCKVSDKIYTLFCFGEDDIEVIEGRVIGFDVWDKYNIRIQANFEEYLPRSVHTREIGKTVFLTFEEAEKALANKQ